MPRYRYAQRCSLKVDREALRRKSGFRPIVGWVLQPCSLESQRRQSAAQHREWKTLWVAGYLQGDVCEGWVGFSWETNCREFDAFRRVEQPR